MSLCLSHSLAAQVADLAVEAVPDGSVLVSGDSCYTITAKKENVDQPIGLVFQSIHREQVNGVEALAIIVHQRLANGKFEMRDSFLLRRADLQPIRLDSARDGAPHVHLDYSGKRVTGWKLVKGTKESIDITFDGPVWDSNLWGLTFAALPLKMGATYRLPTYQYDDGKGNFAVTVTGEKTVETPGGPTGAWVIRAGVKPNQMADYFIGKNPSAELGYSAGPMSQRLGGDCTGLK